MYVERIFCGNIILVLGIANVIGALKNHECKPRSTLISSCAFDECFIPSHIKIRRCQGGFKNPFTHACKAKLRKNVMKEMVDYNGKKRLVTFQEDVSCEERCACGHCDDERISRKCEHGCSWNQSLCKCECPCGLANVKILNEFHKSNTESFSSNDVVMMMVIELVVILLIVAVAMKVYLKYSRKKQSLSVYNNVTYSAIEPSGT